MNIPWRLIFAFLLALVMVFAVMDGSGDQLIPLLSMLIGFLAGGHVDAQNGTKKELPGGLKSPASGQKLN